MFYIYEITNKINGKTYIGQRKCPKKKFPEDDSYMGSGTYITRAEKKQGVDNFSKRILAVAETQENINILEYVFIELAKAEEKAQYNIAAGGYVNPFAYMTAEQKKAHAEKVSKNSLRMWQDEEFKKKRSKQAKTMWKNPEYRRRVKETMDKVCKSDRFKKKVGEASKELWKSDEYRKKIIPSMCSAARNNWANDEYREKNSKILSSAMKVRVTELWKTEEFKKMRSEAAKKLWQNEEFRKKMHEKLSEAQKRRASNPEYKRKCSEIMKKRWALKKARLVGIQLEFQF